MIKYCAINNGLINSVNNVCSRLKRKKSKKTQWMGTDKNGAVNKGEMIAFYKEKKDKKGRSVKAEDIFIGTDHN